MPNFRRRQRRNPSRDRLADLQARIWRAGVHHERAVCGLIIDAAADKNDYLQMLVFSLLRRTFSLQSLTTCVPR
jgi:hypothetical protein